MKKIKVKVTFDEPLLGSFPANKDIYSDYIATLAPDAKTKEEEIASIGVDEYTEKQTTIFPKDENGNPFVWDYQIKGFFKAACSILQKCKGEDFSKASCGIKAFKKIIDGAIFIDERKIPIEMNGKIDILERPLRANTPQGERVALASSEKVPEGSTITFTITCLSDSYAPAVKEWLDYGRYRGLGQWRNASYGRFTYEVL